MLAQTTDSGSNNITLSREMHSHFLSQVAANNDEIADYAWEPDSMHIRCFCHKLALIVNAGLKELGLKAPPPPKVKESLLGRFPIPDSLQAIPEEDKDEDPQANPTANVEINPESNLASITDSEDEFENNHSDSSDFGIDKCDSEDKGPKSPEDQSTLDNNCGLPLAESVPLKHSNCNTFNDLNIITEKV